MFIFCWRTDFKTHIISAQGVEPEKKTKTWLYRSQKFCAPALIVYLEGTFDRKSFQQVAAEFFIFEIEGDR